MQVVASPPEKVSFFDIIQQELNQVEARMRQAPPTAHPNLVEALRYVLDSGGKRVRPAVTLLAGRALGAETDRLIDLAGATEMLHTASLVHDDIIDGSLMRRGVSTLNANWTPGATILTGDYIFARAAQLAAATENVRVISIFADTLMTICNGELHQLFDGRAGQRERQAYFSRIYAKTGSLFALASEAAAVLATDSEKVIRSAREFGKQLGIAFQIVDDILDFIGKQSEVGKPLGSDLRQGLVTLPTLYYLEANPEDTRVHAVLNGQRGNRARMDLVIDAIRQSDAIQKSMIEARQFVDKAKAALDWMPASSERDRLLTLADYVVDRTV